MMSGVDKSTFTPAYTALRERLVSLRRRAGMTQRELADRVGRERSFVARIEQGERRIDLVEFVWVCEACGANPEREVSSLVRQFRRLR